MQIDLHSLESYCLPSSYSSQILYKYINVNLGGGGGGGGGGGEGVGGERGCSESLVS